jgi:hypothetical protein
LRVKVPRQRVLAVLVFLAAAVIVTPPAHADEPAVAVVLDSLNPLIPQPERTLMVTGRAVNINAASLSNIDVRLRIGTRPITDRLELSNIENAQTPPDLRLIASQEIPDGLPQRVQTAFQLSSTFADIALTEPGVYVLRIDVVADQTTVGSLTTFLPWFPSNASVDPVPITWLWPLSDWPARNAAGVLLDDQTPREISPGGRLAELVRIGADHNVTWVIDPALMQTVNAMTSGYQIQRDGQLRIGDRTSAAQNWLTQLREVASEPMWALPYADIDAAASRRAGLTTDVVRAVTSAGAIAGRALGEPVQSGLYWAPFGRIDAPTADLLASSGVTTVVLSSAAIPDGRSGRGVLGTTVGTLDALLIDPVLARLLVAPQQTQNDLLLSRQRFLAETAAMAMAGESIVLGPRNLRWRPTAAFIAPLLRASERAPWMTLTTASDLLAQPAPIGSSGRSAYGERAQNAELAPSYLAQVARVSQRVALLASIVDNPIGITEPFSGALLRAQSASWRTEPETGTALLRSIRSEINAEIAKVQVLASGSVTLSGDTGRVPITIANELAQTVTVGLRLQGDVSTRILSDDVTGIVIEPGKRTSIDIDARVVGGDPVRATVQLLTPSGEVFGTPTPLEIGSTAYARAASWVVISAFIALAIFVVVGVTRRIHRAQRGSADAVSATVGE